MTVVFPAPLVPSRAVIWSLWNVMLRSRMAALWGSYSLVTDTRATPGGPPPAAPAPSCREDPADKMPTHPDGSRSPRSPQNTARPWQRSLGRGSQLTETHPEARVPSPRKPRGQLHHSRNYGAAGRPGGSGSLQGACFSLCLGLCLSLSLHLS